MRLSTVCRALACISALAVIAAFCSCGNDTCGPSGTDSTRETVGGLLEVFTESLGDKDLARYDECLEDGYLYEFAPQDAESLGLASWDPFWGRMEDTSAVGNMFRDEAVKQIAFDLTEIARHRAEDRGDSVVVLTMTTDISLTLEYPGSEPFGFLIRSTRLEVTAAPDPGAEGMWVIRKIKEYYAGGACRALATAPTSFGMLKARFHAISPRSSVSRLLGTYARSCEDRYIEMYGECLADDYLFVFVPDVAESLGLPPWGPWWGKAHDMASMAKLFGSSAVTSIRFDHTPVSSDTLVINDSLTVRIRVEPDIRVLIERPGEDALYYLVNASYLDFRLIPDPRFPDLWVILETKEIRKNRVRQTAANSAVQGFTYSELKAMFE
jgi:hypothetical protein